MRSRTIQEGSVGLLILVAIGIFGGATLWLSGVRLGNRGYSFTTEFNDANGMKLGSPVVYRGVTVGRISEITTSSNGVVVKIEIDRSDLVISIDSAIEVNQSGLIGETSVAIVPKIELDTATLQANPLASDCNGQVIICDGSRLRGELGVSFNQLLQGTLKVSNLYTSEEFFNNVNVLAKNASEAAAGVAKLTRDFSSVTGDVRDLTGTTGLLINNANLSVGQIGDAATITSLAAAQTAARIGDTADEYRVTGAQLNQLLANVNGLVSDNRGSLVNTLNDLSQTSAALRSTVVELSPAISQFASGQLLQNLETLSANAAEASRNLRDVSSAVNNPTTMVVLQQTLDSARATFENVQKITADIDDLTGDPQFRNNLRQLVNGLGSLVSSSQQIEQQVQVAQQLEQIVPGAAQIAVPNPTLNPTPNPTPNIILTTPNTAPVPTTSIGQSSPFLESTPRQLANNYQILPRLSENQVQLEDLP